MKNSNFKKQTALVVKRLEHHFGEPLWQGPQDFLENLIWTLLSQNTNDKNAETAYRRLRSTFADWQTIMNSSAALIADAIRPAGLANQKASRIKTILQWVDQTYATFDLEFLCRSDSHQIQELFLSQKGIGVKTISVTLMAACGHDVFPVDTHVHRISTRLQLIPTNISAEKTHDLMQPLVPKGKCYSLHINMLRLGRTICRARKPKCPECPLTKICPSRHLGLF